MSRVEALLFCLITFTIGGAAFIYFFKVILPERERYFAARKNVLAEIILTDGREIETRLDLDDWYACYQEATRTGGFIEVRETNGHVICIRTIAVLYMQTKLEAQTENHVSSGSPREALVSITEDDSACAALLG
jgi:hypothetical protein